MKPLIYGYLRVTEEEQDEETRLAELDLRRFADAEGFCLATIFYEYTSGSHAAFDMLTEELRRAEAHHVVVPSLAHLSDHPLLRDCLLRQLEQHADAQVSVARSRTDAGSPQTTHPLPSSGSRPGIARDEVRG